MRSFALMLTALLLNACGEPQSFQPPEGAEQEIVALMDEYNAKSVGIGIIRNHELVWTGYYGQQSPDVLVDKETMFNTASVNKAVTAEAALRLASKGVIDLDEPISAYYVHPDLVDDPRHELLTPRVLLTHQAGFRNWPFEYEDGKLAFIDVPGSGNYHYSGAGIRIFAKYLEAKLDKPFPEIIENEVFGPIGMHNATNSHDIASQLPNIVVPVDESGSFIEDHEFETDYWSAADDLYVSVEDYAAFLIATMASNSVDEKHAKERVRVQTDLSKHEIFGCGKELVDPCPEPYGHGIGWFVFGYEDGIVVHHGGNDRSEGAIGYFEPATGNGGVVFVNSTKGVQLWPKIVDSVDPDQDFQDVFHDLIRQFFPETE